MSQWYRRVTGDLTKIPACIEYYEEELVQARKELSLSGIAIEQHAARLPAYVEIRYTQLQEIEAILEYLNIEYKKTRSSVFRKYFERYNRELTSRDAEKYVDGDTEVIDMAYLVNDFALLRNKYLALHKGLDAKNWQISNIVKLRAAGLDDVRID